MEVNGQLHITAALLSGKKSPVTIAYKAWWSPGSAWTLWSREKSLPPCRESNPGRPGRELYRLSYPGSYRKGVSYIKKHIANNNSEEFILGLFKGAGIA
jgi:hypothetical protein